MMSVLINGIDPVFPRVLEIQTRFRSIPVTLDIYRNWNHEMIMYRSMVKNPDLNSREFLMRNS